MTQSPEQLSKADGGGGVRDELVAGDLFVEPREPESIIAEALAYEPCAVFAAFSGGDDSLALTHWMMENVPGCQVFHANTGIGVERTREFVRDTCRDNGWPLHEIHAEESGQSYRNSVLQWGFPGPAMHGRMYSRLKERSVRLLVRRHKQHRRDKVLIATGIHKDESRRRMGYGERVIDSRGAQLWVNPLYWWPSSRFSQYIREQNLRRNPVSEILGMSGECLCGAFAHPGEKALIRAAAPETADYIDELEAEVRDAGFDWGWEDRPPREPTGETEDSPLMPFCHGCEKRGAI